ncbi:MAG TPA: hypothetical protein VJQ82_02650 [Terriglobales bacterium]|nr:hypothetical protein [Terriglobales bacterium]
MTAAEEITTIDPRMIRFGSKQEKPIRKTIYTLNVNNFEPRIREITYPLIDTYAKKIGAEFVEITERLRPEWPVTIEKFQVADLARERGDDWAIFFDADTLINPEFFDPTEHMAKDTVAHNGKDMAGTRWTYDKYFRRDGRHWSSCTWCVYASDWTVEDLWLPPQRTPEEEFANIHITIGEHNSGECKREHLIDDYTLSRNISRFGLKATTITDICAGLGWKSPDGRGFNQFLWHVYTKSTRKKIHEMLGVLTAQLGGPAFPFGIPGEIVTGPGGQPVFRTTAPSEYGNPGQLVGPIGQGWQVLDPGHAGAMLKKWGM